MFDEVPLEVTIHDEGGVVKEVLGNGNLRLVQVKSNRVIVHLLDIGSLQVGHESQDRGADLRVQPLAEVEEDIIGRKRLPVVEEDTLPKMECPGGDVVVRLPAFEQPGTRDVVWSRFG